jgi:hypothetical protein
MVLSAAEFFSGNVCNEKTLQNFQTLLVISYSTSKKCHMRGPMNISMPRLTLSRLYIYLSSLCMISLVCGLRGVKTREVRADKSRDKKTGTKTRSRRAAADTAGGKRRSHGLRDHEAYIERWRYNYKEYFLKNRNHKQVFYFVHINR